MLGVALQLAGAAEDVRLDWARLTNPESGAPIAVRWRGGGRGTVDVLVDDDRDAANGFLAPLALGAPNDGVLDARAPWLPPGRYYVAVRAGDGAPAYSPGTVEVVPAPILRFTAPSALSGADYATAELGDPWDMAARSDLLSGGDWEWSWNGLAGFPRFDGGLLQATSRGPDPFLFLAVDPERPIRTARYRFLSWRASYAGGPWRDASDRLGPESGWVQRFHYWAGWPLEAGTMNSLQDVVIWEGWNTSQLDLAEGHLDDDRAGPGAGWSGRKTGLRFDPVEGTLPTAFSLDWVKLTAEPSARAGEAYEIAWTLRAGSRPVTIRLALDTDRDAGNGLGPLVAELVPPAAPPSRPPSASVGPFRALLPRLEAGRPAYRPPTSFRWQPPAGLDGRYYLTAEVDDGLSRMRWYSEVPLAIEP
jgi:hypothetical protein